jgi:hypothetical protein
LAGDALSQEEVQAGIADYLSTQIATAVDLDARLEEVLPSALARFAPVIASAANEAVDRTIQRALANEEVQSFLETAVERAHARALRVLQGDGIADGVTVSDGEVSLNLLPLVGRGFAALQNAGLLTNVQLPDLSADGDPATQIAELSEATGLNLPDDFGQVVVYQSDSIAEAQESVQTAQRLLVIAQRALWVAVVLSIVLVAATILVAARRWRAVLVLGLGVAAAMIILRSAARRAVDDAPALVKRPGAKAAVSSILDDATNSLLRLAGVILLLALVTVVVMLLRTRWQRSDLVLVASVLLGAGTFALIGATVLGLVIGVLVAVAVAVITPRVLPSVWPRPPATGTDEPPTVAPRPTPDSPPLQEV